MWWPWHRKKPFEKAVEDAFAEAMQPDIDVDEWILVPFRFAEAARVSIYTIGSSKNLDPAMRWWIASWLAGYNAQLVDYMREKYGEDIFPLLDAITTDVMPDPQDDDEERADTVPLPADKLKASAQDVSDESWEQWEKQFKGETEPPKGQP